VRVTLLVAGTAGLHCGACVRDLALVRGLNARGHDVTVMPLYLPLGPEHGDLATTPVQIDGINAWLQQASPLFRWTPGWFDRLLAAGPLLRLAGRSAGTTQAAGLGPLTVSMLRGAEGNQRKQVAAMLDALAPLRPETVIISNALLLGLAPALRARLGVPVLCGLQGEEGFVDELPQPWRDQALALMREHAAVVDRFLAPYAGYAPAWFDLAPGRIAVLPTGIDLRLHHPAAEAQPLDGTLTVGFCSVLLRRKGPDLLVEAATRLPTDLRRRIRLIIAGQPLDRDLLHALRRRCADAGLAAEFPGGLEPVAKCRLMQSVHVFCAPSRTPEVRGLAGLEALACGAPLVAADSGIFPELARSHEGITVVRPDDVDALARGLMAVLADPATARARALRGAASVAAAHGQEAIGAVAEAILSRR
jgi:glycosyltransferase involved in cell wall biosynthesis